MTSFQEAFAIFDAIDVPGITAQMNVWGGNLESAVSELRSAVLMQGAELEAIRNGLALIEQRTEQVTQFGGKAVAELDAIMTSFRAEIVLNKSERIAEGEALKGELRQLVVDLQAKFLEVEGAIRTLTATAAATGHNRAQPPGPLVPIWPALTWPARGLRHGRRRRALPARLWPSWRLALAGSTGTSRCLGFAASLGLNLAEREA